MADGGSELLLNAEPWKWKTDLLVESAESASKRFEEAGGSVISGPFDIEIGKAVVVRDPWGNEFVLLDASKGQLATDADKNVVGVENYSGITLKGTRYAIDDVVRARSAVLDRFNDQ